MSFTNNGSHQTRKKVLAHSKISAIGTSAHYDNEFKLSKRDLELYTDFVMYGFTKSQRENEKF